MNVAFRHAWPRQQSGTTSRLVPRPYIDWLADVPDFAEGVKKPVELDKHRTRKKTALVTASLYNDIHCLFAHCHDY